jgi:AraC-like DNA-binding protein
MESLNIRDRNPGFDGENFAPGHLCQTNSQKVITTIKHRMAVQKVLDLISNRLHDPPTLDELAFLAGLSKSYLSSVFKEVVGMGLQDYLFQARINKAKDLLGDINLTIKQIAYEVGFRDPDHFSRTFKKKTGITPTNWRLRNIENSPSWGS